MLEYEITATRVDAHGSLMHDPKIIQARHGGLCIRRAFFDLYHSPPPIRSMMILDQS